jgi:hypothetical protein
VSLRSRRAASRFRCRSAARPSLRIPVDAAAAARTVQAGEATGTPKAQNGTVEMTRALRVARQTAVKAGTQAINAIKALLVTAPVELRERLDSLPTSRLVRQAATLDPGQVATPTAAYMLAVRSLAERYQHLGAEIVVLTKSWTASPPPTRLYCAPCWESAPKSPPNCWCAPGTTPPDWVRRPRSRRCAAPPRWRPRRARPAGIA